MKNQPVYLDYNATAPVRPEVVLKMQELLAFPANPASAHSFGREAKKHLEAARKTIGDIISAWPQEIIFTASGTEANALALHSFPGRRMLLSPVEHSSVLKQSLPTESKRDYRIPVTSQGSVDVAALDRMLAIEPQPTLVSVMLANNETGVIQPIREIAAVCKKRGALLHCDAVQAIGKIPVDFGALGVDLLTLAGHKCGGPVGAAALVVRRDQPVIPLLLGGGQELGRRAGTENIPSIAGFSKALELIDFEHMKQLRSWLDAMEDQLIGATVFGKAAPRLPNTSCIAMPEAGNELQLIDFDLKGFAVSAGSACSSGRIEPSHVLSAMGVAKTLASCAIRVSGGWKTAEKDVILFTGAWLKLHDRLTQKAKADCAKDADSVAIAAPAQ